MLYVAIFIFHATWAATFCFLRVDLACAVSVSDNAQLLVYYIQISVLMHKCVVFASCSNQNDQQQIRKASSESETIPA